MLVSTHVTKSTPCCRAVDIFYMLSALGDEVLGDWVLFTTYSPTFDSGFGLWDIRVVGCAATDSEAATRANNPTVDRGIQMRYKRGVGSSEWLASHQAGVITL